MVLVLILGMGCPVPTLPTLHTYGARAAPDGTKVDRWERDLVTSPSLHDGRRLLFHF